MIIRKLSDNTKIYIERYFAVVDEMAENMRNVEETDSISEMFILQMIAVYEGGVRIGENILSYTTNSNIENLAKSIVEGGNRDIEDLKEMLDFCRNCKNDDRDVSLYQRRFKSILENMISSMNGINVSNNIDLDFLSGMIYHHEGEISMAKNVLGYDICENLKNYAEKLITTHELQLGQMRQMIRMLG